MEQIIKCVVKAFIMVAAIFLLVWTLNLHSDISRFQINHLRISKNVRENVDAMELALREASMPNKTLIIAIVNKAYVEGDKSMLDLFLDSFWLGENTWDLIDHLLLVAVDQMSFDRCKFLRLHCYKLETAGVDFGGEQIYLSDAFIDMMWRRTLFLRDLLKRGYNFIFTDTDVMWLRNPFPKMSNNSTIDIQISTDYFNGDQWSKTNPINTGFYMIRSNNKTIKLFEKWYERRTNSTGLKEQDVLVKMMNENVLRELGIRMKILDTNYFSGFCENSKDVRVVSTIHANCCRTIGAKVADLTAVIRDWKRMKSCLENCTTSWSPHNACIHSW